MMHGLSWLSVQSSNGTSAAVPPSCHAVDRRLPHPFNTSYRADGLRRLSAAFLTSSDTFKTCERKVDDGKNKKSLRDSTVPTFSSVCVDQMRTPSRLAVSSFTCIISSLPCLAASFRSGSARFPGAKACLMAPFRQGVSLSAQRSPRTQSSLHTSTDLPALLYHTAHIVDTFF